MGKRQRRQFHPGRSGSPRPVRKRSPIGYLAAGAAAAGLAALLYLGWPGGLGSGRSDAAHVVHPASFRVPRIAAAYRIASQIPATLNQLYCWCGCHRHSGHRSNLACFESDHGAECDICIETAEIAWRLAQQGVTDPAAIQRQVDATLGPPGRSPG